MKIYMENIKNRLNLPLGVPSMPIPDAIPLFEELDQISNEMANGNRVKINL